MMQEIQVPKDVTVKISEDGSEIAIAGKLGSTSKKVNRSLLTAKLSGEKLTLEETASKKLMKKAGLVAQALASELRSACEGVDKGIECKMKIVYAHFPVSVEIKGKEMHVKNMFGERNPRIAKIVGDTKVEVKGQDVSIKGVDPYDVGQTAANIRRLSFVRKKDTRVFQDGIYYVKEE